jgi:predicted ribosomally synthesized peptide with nif11-like leader
MSQTDLEQFCERVLQNQSLQEKLRSIPDRQAFIASVVQLGTEQGFTFSVEEVQTAMQNRTRAWIERFVC